MRNIKCLLGMHTYSDAFLELKVVDERSGHLICRVRNCCLNCGKTFEDIVSIPLPEWLSRKDEVKE